MEIIPTTNHIVSSRLLLCLSFPAIDLGYAVRVMETCAVNAACLVEDLAGDILIPGSGQIQNTVSGHIKSSIQLLDYVMWMSFDCYPHISSVFTGSEFY